MSEYLRTKLAQRHNIAKIENHRLVNPQVHLASTPTSEELFQVLENEFIPPLVSEIEFGDDRLFQLLKIGSDDIIFTKSENFRTVEDTETTRTRTNYYCFGLIFRHRKMQLVAERKQSFPKNSSAYYSKYEKATFNFWHIDDNESKRAIMEIKLKYG